MDGDRPERTASDQVDAVARVVTDVLADAVLGVYLHGSSVLGRLRPTSDLDIFAVARARTSDDQRRELIERLLPMSGPGDPTGRSRSVNLEIVAQGDVRPWRYPGRLDVQYGDWFRPAFAKGDLAPWDPLSPDLPVLLEMVIRSGRPLLGPSPSALIGPIPWADVRRAMLDSIPDLVSYLDGDERNVVLTFARIWMTMATAEFASKDAAADWAVRRLPEEHREVMQRARDLYVDGVAEERWGDLLPRVLPLVDHVIGQIRDAARIPERHPPPPLGRAV